MCTQENSCYKVSHVCTFTGCSRVKSLSPHTTCMKVDSTHWLRSRLAASCCCNCPLNCNFSSSMSLTFTCKSSNTALWSKDNFSTEETVNRRTRVGSHQGLGWGVPRTRVGVQRIRVGVPWNRMGEGLPWTRVVCYLVHTYINHLAIYLGSSESQSQ